MRAVEEKGSLENQQGESGLANGCGTTTVRQLLRGKGSARVLTIHPEATVFEALALMAQEDVGALIVVDEDRVLGVVSERDYARKVILIGKSSRETPVREIMSAPAITVGTETTVAECMRLMTRHRLRHLPVIELWELVGCVSIGDAVKAIIGEQERLIEEYASYIHGQYPA